MDSETALHCQTRFPNADFSDHSSLNGLVVLNTVSRGTAGMNKALLDLQPYLEKKHIQLHFIADKSPKLLLRSMLRVLLKEKSRKYDFMIFNALASLHAARTAYLISRVARFIHLPIFVYWRELDISFNELAQRQPSSIKWIDRFAKQPGLIHLVNSVATSDYIAARYPGTQPVETLNCAFVPFPFDRPVLPSVDRPYVVNVGSIQYKKGTDLFVEVAIKVCQQHPTVEFLWLGSGHLEDKIRDKITQAGLGERILFPGYVTAAYALMRRASAVLLSSRQESFSQTTAEAMAMGRQVVTFESGGPPELLGGSGTVIPNFDTDKAAAAILEILSLPEEETINKNLRARYLELYSPDQHAKRLSNAIRAHIKS